MLDPETARLGQEALATAMAEVFEEAHEIATRTPEDQQAWKTTAEDLGSAVEALASLSAALTVLVRLSRQEPRLGRSR